MTTPENEQPAEDAPAPAADAPAADAPATPDAPADPPADAPAADAPADAAAKDAPADAAETDAPADSDAASGDKSAVSTEDAAAVIEAAAETLIHTFKLALEILPRPTSGIVKYASSKPGFAPSLAIIVVATLLFPLLTMLSAPKFILKLMLTGTLSICLAHIGLAVVLFLGLKVHFKRTIDHKELMALFAASLIPFIPMILIGWLLNFIKGGLFASGVVCGTLLAALYLNAGLRELYKLSDDQAIYFSALCYTTWTLVFYAGL